MDQKSRRWRKKPCNEKTIVIPNETHNMFPPNVDDENQLLQLDQLTSACICDPTNIRNSRMVAEATAGRQKAEAEVLYLKQELEKATHQGFAAEERLAHLDAALKGCMQQINSLREEQDVDYDDDNSLTVSDISRERKKKRWIEVELAEAKENLSRTASENTQLRNSLLRKEDLIKELEQERQCLESEFDVLMARSESVEKENTLLKYECCALEREMTALNEGRKYYSSTINPPIGSLKKVTELEAECQQLRLMLQRKVVGQGQGAVNVNSRRRRLNGENGSVICRDQVNSNGKKINFLLDRLCDVEEENNALRNALSAKDKELRDSKLKCAETDYRLAVVEARMKIFTGTENNEQQKQITSYCEAPLLSNHGSSLGSNSNDDQNGISESWATVLLSELEHSRMVGQEEDPKALSSSNSKMSLMNHFVKDSIDESTQEKLAIVVDHTDRRGLQGTENQLSKDIIPVVAHIKGQIKTSRETGSTEKRRGNWPWDALQIILEEHLISKRSFGELMEDIRSALAQSCPGLSGLETKQTSENGTLSAGAERLIDGASSSLSMSMCRIIELLEGISPSSLIESSEKNSESQQSSPNTDYSVYVFRWRNSELIGIIKRFILACSCLISSVNNNDLETFASELKSALEWTVSKCITLQDASQARDKIRKHFGLDRPKSEGELDITTTAILGNHHHNVLSQLIKIQYNLQEVNKGLRNELESVDSTNQELEMKMRSVKEENKALMKQLQEAKDSIRKLQMEVEELGETKGEVEEQMENLKMINEDLDTRLSVARSKLNENLQQISSLEVELEDKNSCCEELEAVCLELQLQLEIVSKKGSPNSELVKGWDTRTALVRLSEHEKTIQAVETLMEDEYDSSPTTTNCENMRCHQHFTLRDRILAEEDNAELKEPVLVTPGAMEKPPIHQEHADSVMRTINHSPTKPADNNLTLAVVPAAKKSGGGFGIIRKLFWRRKWSTNKKKTSIALHRTSSNLMR